MITRGDRAHGAREQEAHGGIESASARSALAAAGADGDERDLPQADLTGPAGEQDASEMAMIE